MLKKIKSKLIFGLLMVCITFTGFSQPVDKEQLAGQENTITSAVPFLIIAPDSRSGAMGDAGVATSPDANSMHWNPSKYAFVENDMGLSISYTPWLRNLTDDIDLSYVAGYKRIDDRQVVGAALRYFSMGEIIFTNAQGQEIRPYNPNEFAVSGAYSLLLSDNLSGSVAIRYIYSNLSGGIGEIESHPGQSVAGDVSFFYQDDIEVSGYDSKLGLGVNISNIGAKISYTDESVQNFIPINMRLGGALTMNIDDYNQIMFTADVNKLLIPTPYKVLQDEEGNDSIVGTNQNDVSVAGGIFGSFSDAPGGWREELNEIMYAVGAEYWYNKQFAVRMGYFHEHENKGNRKYFTMGVGLKMNVFGLDFSYLVPTQGRQNPLANTVRFTLHFDFEGFKEQAR